MRIHCLKYLLWFLPLALLSCVSLDEDPASNQVSQQFYSDEEDAVAAVNAIYEMLHTKDSYLPMSLYNGLIQIATEMAADDYVAGPRARNAHVRAIAALTYDASNNRVDEIWRESYMCINRANIAVDRIAAMKSDKISDQMRKRLTGEAKFLRALMYFNLVRWFGDVPLVLHETTELTDEALQVEKSPAEEVYRQIISDLKDAESLPKPSEYAAADAGRATCGAASSLLALVYLTHQDWQLAADKSGEVMGSGMYALFPNFADVFDAKTKNGQEHIFSVQYQGNANYVGNHLANLSAAYDVPGVNGDFAHAMNLKSGLYGSFRPEDKRLPVTFVTSMVSPTDGKTYQLSEPHFYKYYDPSVAGDQYESSRNFPVMRYAEVLLIRAEALNEVSGPTDAAYAAIDAVRRRAGIPLLKDIAPGMTQSQFRDSVFQERRREFVYEHKRWFDLSRRGADYYVQTLHAAGKMNAQPKHIHFPIPQRELDLNKKLKQNPDWE